MTDYVLRVDPASPAVANATMLDWFPGSQRSTVQASADLLEGLESPAAAVDLFALGVAAYCADRLERRRREDGQWTRNVRLTVPAGSPRMRAALPTLTAALRFVTSDRWTVTLTRRAVARGRRSAARSVDAVCLFSGGLDSLAGAIDLLEAGERVCLLSHYEGGLAPRRQTELAQRLRKEYGRDQVVHRTLFLRPATPNDLQEQPLSDERENTTRGRSVLFIAAGVAVATGYGSAVPLYVPENGLIGINVPLTAARPASLSTRTTHPHFMNSMRHGLEQLRLMTELRNPYRMATKGEMLANSRNRKLLAALARISLSCAHPEAGRLHRRKVGNCGYCFPCLIRRAALHQIGADSGADYALDVLRDPSVLSLDDAGADLRALLLSLGRPARDLDVLRNGPIPSQEVAAFASTYERGRAELRSWLLAGGHRRINAALAHDA